MLCSQPPRNYSRGILIGVGRAFCLLKKAFTRRFSRGDGHSIEAVYTSRNVCTGWGSSHFYIAPREKESWNVYCCEKHEILVTLKRLWFSLDGQSIAFTRFLFRSLGGHAPSHAHCKSVCVVGLDWRRWHFLVELVVVQEFYIFAWKWYDGWIFTRFLQFFFFLRSAHSPNWCRLRVAEVRRHHICVCHRF